MATFYVFAVMLFSGLLTSLVLVLLYSTGLLRFPLLAPVISPIVALLASTIIGTSVSVFAGERFLKPLNRLIDATKIVSRGDFSVRVEESEGESEVAELLRNFNRMVEELGSIEMLRNDFINDFSHEFKTPIVSIRGFARQLQDESLPPERRREYADIIVKESERLSRMAASILLLARFENQQIVTGAEEYELDEQLRDCVILLEKEWSARDIRMELDLASLRIRANEEMLSHVWINLLDNAIKFSEPSGRVTVTCGPAGAEAGCREALVSIRDEGVGMDEATVRHIFDKFYQGEKSHGGKGNGLGLPIARRIVELCGGSIAVESEVGRGSVFTIRLPLGSIEAQK
jgi:signal transduction histidine kinase